jgi:hypothetical protein
LRFGSIGFGLKHYGARSKFGLISAVPGLLASTVAVLSEVRMSWQDSFVQSDAYFCVRRFYFIFQVVACKNCMTDMQKLLLSAVQKEI